MAITFPQPKNTLLSEFIIETNAIEHTPVSLPDIEATRSRKQIHPHVAGHLAAIRYTIENLVKNWKFPAYHPIQWATESSADSNLEWLRTLHKKVMTPVAEYGATVPDANYIKLADCGNYRLDPLRIGFDRWMPKATSIPKLLQLWLQDLGSFHLGVANKLNHPTPTLLAQLVAKAQEAHLQLVCIHPWSDGSGLVGRLLENALRLRWGLPWKIFKAENVVAHIADIQRLEDSPEWRRHILENKAKQT
jgi:hypothetical protein